MKTILCCLLLSVSACGPGAVAKDMVERTDRGLVADLIVDTDKGKVEGTLDLIKHTPLFLGIPYAAPPVKERRWKPPAPVTAWQGVREASDFGPRCPQVDDSVWTKPTPTSEDCLYLNVWTPASGGNHPVMFYIHGGGYLVGDAGDMGIGPLLNGVHLAANRNVVVVTINYRLGIFGFLTHPELTTESSHHSSGNYGLLDAVAALQWVKRNIAAFGGDPLRVTIAGQSAGASAVHALTASPLAKGLFHRAIAESGSSIGRRSRELAETEKDGVKFAEAKGAHTIADIRAIPAKDLMGGGGGIRFGVVVDGWFLPADIAAIIAQGKQHDVPILTGLTADEGSASPTYGNLKPDEFWKQAQQRFGDLAETFQKLYPSGDQTQSAASQKQSAREQGMVSMYHWAADRARTSKAKAWTYYFSRGIPWPEQPQFGAFHTSEVPYVFGNLSLLNRPWQPVDRQLSATMMGYWVNFATTGDPNGAGLPAWPAFEKNKRLTMELGEKPGPRQVADDARFEFFEKFFSKQQAQ